MGVYCDCCGVCSDSDCIKTADKKLPCKVSASSVEVQLHHWTKGMLACLNCSLYIHIVFQIVFYALFCNN